MTDPVPTIAVKVNYLKYVAIALFVVILALLTYGGITKWTYDRTITQLQNDIATRDQTIETHAGVYEKLALETSSLKALLDQKSTEVASLTKDLDARGEDLLTANNLVLHWKQKYEATGDGGQVIVHGDPGEPDRIKVDFTKDFGYIQVDGFTMTSPPEYWVSVTNKRPLKLTLVVGQLKNGSWKADVTSSEDNVGVDIAVAAVNPSIFDERWYEKIGIDLDLGAGGTGFLGAVGAKYEFGKFELGPKVWLNVGGSGVNTFYGGAITWHPFHR